MKRVIACVVALAALPVLAAVNFAETVSLGANGSYVLGNPRAKVRVVEYLSYTCSHCADFTATARGVMTQGAIARGEASYEMRNSVRDRYDYAASVIARCGGPGKFLGNTEALMASQSVWIEHAKAMEQSKGKALSKMTPTVGVRTIVNTIGLNGVMRVRGFTPAQINACAVDPAAHKAVDAMDKDSQNRVKVPYTPYFVINGAPAESISNWSQMEAMISYYFNK